ncbi:carbohydrate ABC transporter permease [Parablautia muri]|uniref:Carbohydrate ABC transporter permease n=1 Tax=Parablautia muri TaxID=2320879 RepID=A0A9X5BFC2_9FIRM|nr:carbohydrate ABC transporter permease [Parablautia muri]NBJ92608.1 carbohydrate ABC transporter permease [Parablautia muri]
MVEKNRSFQIGVHLFMIILTLFCLIPFLLLVVSSFTAESALLKNGYSFFPSKISFDAYKTLLVDSSSIMRGYFLSFVVTVSGTLCNILLTLLFAYPLSRRDLPGKGFFSFMVFFTMLFNGGLVPTYMMWTGVFHIKNTLWALIVPNLMMGAFYVIMMRTYFTTNIPEAVLEAARIDGAGEFRTLVKVVVPMSKPIIATIVLLVGLNYWNDWLNGLYYVNDDRLYSIQVLLNKMLMDVQYLMTNAASGAMNQSIQLPATGIKMAVAVMGALPMFIIYPFFQQYFVQGIVIGAVKG